MPSPSQEGVLIPVPGPTTRRSPALDSQIGGGHEPLAQQPLPIGLTLLGVDFLPGTQEASFHR